MALTRYTASADTTITDAFDPTISTRGTGSNMGLADSLEVFSIFGQDSGSAGRSVEKSRILVKFPVTAMSTDRDAGTIPGSGSVSWYLRLYNVEHSLTLPNEYTLAVKPISKTWDEGRGMDMDSYTDRDICNWVAASSSSSGITNWAAQGGDYHTTANTLYSQIFTKGYEDLEIDISELVEQWIAGTKANYGVGIMMSGAYEDGTDKRSYYTKRFSARGTQYFFKRPTIEARWDKAKTDDRANFYLSSSMAPAADNLNTLYLYNYVRGQLKNIPAVGETGSVLVSLYSGTTAPSGDKLGMPAGGNVATANHLNVTGGYVSTGIYSASFAATSSIASTEYFYDVWHSGGIEYYTGSAITPKTFAGSHLDPNPKYVVNITNLKTKYDRDEKARFRLFTRLQNWNPTIYTKATATAETEIVEKIFYSVQRPYDNIEVIPYGTGSVEYTKLSYDASGSYFDLDMDMLESGYLYELRFMHYVNGKYVEQSEKFRFKVR